MTDLSSVSSSKLIVPNRTDWFNIVEVPAETPEKLDRFARERLLERAQKPSKRIIKLTWKNLPQTLHKRSSCLKSCLMVL